MERNEITILRCGLCKKPFSYVPTPEDKCPPGSPSQICDGCCLSLLDPSDPDYQRIESSMRKK